jgi:DNA-binding MarR family transcriptional regulator
MRRLTLDDTADARMYLFGFARDLSQKSKKLKLPLHGSVVVHWLLTCEGHEDSYRDVQTKCELSDNQMATVVRGLVKRKMIRRVHDEKDHRILRLRLTDKATSAFGTLTLPVPAVKQIDCE